MNTFACLSLVLGVVYFLVSPIYSMGLDSCGEGKTFDFLTLSVFWPQSSCVYFRKHHSDCFIPQGIRGFTIHGLWPSCESGAEPAFCDPSLPFNYTQIQSMKERLEKDWPYYNKSGEFNELWDHEWEKHGTCAQSLPALYQEKKYFSKTMDLYEHFNVTKALFESGLFPAATKKYTAEDFYQAVLSYFNVKPIIACDYNYEDRQLYLDQIYLCFNKEFSLRDCPESEAVKMSRKKHQVKSKAVTSSPFVDCDNGKKTIYFQPIQHSNASKHQGEVRGNSLFFKSWIYERIIHKTRSSVG